LASHVSREHSSDGRTCHCLGFLSKSHLAQTFPIYSDILYGLGLLGHWLTNSIDYSVVKDSPEPSVRSPGSDAQLQRFDEHMKSEFPSFFKEKLQKFWQSETEMESEEIRKAKENIGRLATSVFPEILEEFFQRWQQSQESRSSVSQLQQTPGYEMSGEAQPSALVPNHPRQGVEAFFVPPPAPQSGSLSLSTIRQVSQTSKPSSDSGYYSTGNSSYGPFQGSSIYGPQQQVPEFTCPNIEPRTNAYPVPAPMLGEPPSFDSTVKQSDFGLGNGSQWTLDSSLTVPGLEDEATIGFDMLQAQGGVQSLFDPNFFGMPDDFDLDFRGEEPDP